MAQPKYVDWDGLVYYDGKIKEYIATRDAQGIKMGGVIPFAELPDPSFTNLNYIYKITDRFTSNRDFEKPNLIYKENTWVQCANINNTDTYLYIIFNDNEMGGQSSDVDLENYYTKDEIDSTFVTKVDIDELSDDVDKAIQGVLELAASVDTNADDIETLKQDLADTEAKFDDIESTVKSIKVPTKTSELTNDSNFVTTADVYKNTEVDAIVQDLASKKELDGAVSVLEEKIENINNPEIDLTDYYTKAQTDAAIQTAVDGIDIPEVNLDPYATTEYVDAEVAKIVVPTKVSELENDTDYISSTTVDTKIAEAVGGIEIPDTSNFLTEIPAEYVTETELAAVENKIPSIEGLATTDYVDGQIGSIDIPDVSAKADDVLFTKDMRVTNALGNFIIDESVQNMPIAEILTKLLGLIEYVPVVDPEGILEGTPASAVKLIEENTPSYMLANNGDIVPNEYNYRLLTNSEAKLDNQTDSFFYQIVDDENKAVETGYHITTEYLDEGFLTVFIPENVTEFEVKVFDATSSDWAVPEWRLIENTERQLDGYVAYTADPAYEIYEGIAIRVVIK